VGQEDQPTVLARVARRHLRLRGSVVSGLVVALVALAIVPTSASAAVVADWPQYLHDSSRSGFTTDNAVTATNAASLAPRPKWPVSLGGQGLSTQPVVVNGLIYMGSWDGNEYALNSSGSVLWKTALGTTTPSDPNCGGSLGVVSTPALASVTVAGDSQPSSVLFVGGGGNDSAGGGQAKLEALDAATGRVRWQAPVGPSPSTLIYSSPVVYTPAGATVPSVYIGVSSYGDCPLVQGKLLQFDARDGWPQHEFDVVPNGCLGGGIWGSPTIDPSDGSVYTATGNGVSCNTAGGHLEQVVKLRAWDLTLVSSWQVPASQSSDDNDFGSAPTLFSGTVTPTGAKRSLVGIGSKNGLFYVFNRASLGAGPVAQLRIAIGGTAPEDGQGTISPAAWDGTSLYVGGGQPFANNTSLKGVVYAWNPNNLSAPLWTDPMPGTVLGAVTAAPGIVVFGQGPTLSVVRASDGSGLRWLTAGSSIFDGAPSISRGVLYEGDTGGRLFAYSVNGA
jgi:polyvinyl alcohol dehydrogenase (cytochrome)